MGASLEGHSEVVQLLLAAHANVNAQDQVRLEMYVAMCILYHNASSICWALLAILASMQKCQLNIYIVTIAILIKVHITSM